MEKIFFSSGPYFFQRECAETMHYKDYLALSFLLSFLLYFPTSSCAMLCQIDYHHLPNLIVLVGIKPKVSNYCEYKRVLNYPHKEVKHINKSNISKKGKKIINNAHRLILYIYFKLKKELWLKKYFLKKKQLKRIFSQNISMCIFTYA